MGVQIDLIVPPIILGLLIILIFNVNAFILETSIDNRLTNDMQTFADVTVDIVQEELRGFDKFDSAESVAKGYEINDYVEPEDAEVESSGPNKYYSGIVYKIRRQDGTDYEVEMWFEDGLLYIEKEGVPDPIVYPGYIKDMMFIVDSSTSEPSFVTVRVTTESRPEMHARFGNDENLVRAFAEKRIYLRNVGL